MRASLAPVPYLGDSNGLENSEDCRSAGGHGNQHVRLRSAQIDYTGTICPARKQSCHRAEAGAPEHLPIFGRLSRFPSLKSRRLAYVEPFRRISDVPGIEEIELSSTAGKMGEIPRFRGDAM